MLVISTADREALLAAAYRAYPLECCALLAGPSPAESVPAARTPADATDGTADPAAVDATGGATDATGGMAASAAVDVADDRQVVTRVYPCRNAAESSRHYTVDGRDHLRAERDAEANGWEIIGVAHSHTHSEPFPSPTDVAQAPDPGWHYLIVGLKRDAAETRSYRIVDGRVVEESVAFAATPTHR